MYVLSLHSPGATVGHYLERNAPSWLNAISILNACDVAKNIVAAIIRLNKAEAFLEPCFDGAVLHIYSLI